jgi:hypothetical protein
MPANSRNVRAFWDAAGRHPGLIKALTFGDDQGLIISLHAIVYEIDPGAIADERFREAHSLEYPGLRAAIERVLADRERSGASKQGPEEPPSHGIVAAFRTALARSPALRVALVHSEQAIARFCAADVAATLDRGVLGDRRAGVMGDWAGTGFAPYREHLEGLLQLREVSRWGTR